MASGNDRLSEREGNDVTISPQDISKRVTAGDYILMEKKNVKGSRVWEQFWIDEMQPVAHLARKFIQYIKSFH